MTASYIAHHPEQQQLLPSALQDWLPQGHLAYFINDTFDSLNLVKFHARYAKDGPRNQPFHPAMMVKVMVYAYATGTFSSRKIAKKLFEDVAYRVLAAENFPAHRTIRDFRALHLAEFTELFVQFVRLAREMGLAKLGTVAIDGTKIKTNAMARIAMSYGRMQTASLSSKPRSRPWCKKQPTQTMLKKRARSGYPRRDCPQARAPGSHSSGCSVLSRLAKPRDEKRYPHTTAMAAKFETAQCKLDYAKRKWIAEPPNGWIKSVLGFRQFSMRGLDKANAEFKLVCMALNLRTMGAMQMA